MKEDIQVRSNEAQREIRKKEKLEKECKQSKSEMESKNTELKTKSGQLQRIQEENLRVEQLLKEQRVIFTSPSWNKTNIFDYFYFFSYFETFFYFDFIFKSFYF